MVLHHGRLCVRPFAGSRRDRGGSGCGRQGARQCAPSPEHVRFQFLSAAGPGVRRQGGRLRQWRWRHGQRRQTGQRVWAHQKPVDGRIADLHLRRSPHGARGHTETALDHRRELKAAQGLKFVTAFYWDRDAESRAWSKRFFEKQGRMPTMAQASVYSAVRHYLIAIAAAGTDEAKAVMAKMRALPVNDFYVKNGHLREDGRLVHDMYFSQVKTPSESTRP